MHEPLLKWYLGPHDLLSDPLDYLFRQKSYAAVDSQVRNLAESYHLVDFLLAHPKKSSEFLHFHW